MALDSGNVRVAVTGAVSVGNLGATPPTDADSALAQHTDLGYVGEDGVTEARDRTTNSIKGWQNADVLRETVTEANFTLQFVMVETKKETVETFYGTSVDVSDGSLIVVPALTGGRKSYVLDVIDGDEFIRTYVPQGEIIEVGELVYSNGEAIGYPVTVKGYPDPSLVDDDGNTGTAKKWYSSLVS